MHTIMPGVFQFRSFSSVALSESRCIFPLELSSSPCNSFFMSFIHSGFLLCSLRSNIFLQNCFISYAFSCLYVFVYSPPTCGQNFFFFRYLWISFFFFFCLYCLTLSQYLFSFPSFASTFWLVPTNSIFVFVLLAALIYYFYSYWFPCFSLS